MTFNHKAVRERLKAFDFKGLFTQALHWNLPHSPAQHISVEGITYTLEPVADRSLVAFTCVPPANAKVPDYPTRRKIDAKVTKLAREHIIIYHDQARTFQIWQWVKRERGKPAVCREQQFHIGQSGDALIHKLQGLQFAIEDDPNVVETSARLDSAFYAEKVTKKFYDLFKKEHEAFKKFINGIPDQDMQKWYVSVMLNRLMFIYFIQKKGFLGDDYNYLGNKLAESQLRGRDKFYCEFLCPLFFEGFAAREEQRSQRINRLLGKVPYLNGGLFLKHQIEELYGDKIEIPDKAFAKIFAFFNDWDWHLDDRPARSGKEINPDVLGYVFEKYINQKEMGAYYSKEDITDYIGKNTIIPALFDIVQKSCRIALEGEHSVWRLLQEDPDRYIYDAMRKGVEIDLPADIASGIRDVSKRGGWNRPADAEYALPTEIWREVVARRQRYEEVREKLASGEVRSINDLIAYNLDIRQFAEDVVLNEEHGAELIWSFYKAIRGLSVLDPACGSGAFLFAALNILEPLYDACLVRMQAFVDDLTRSGERHRPEKMSHFRDELQKVNDKNLHPSPRYFVLKSIVLNNLYGVDIMEEATEICKLRLFLKLVAQLNPGEKIEPLPDIDFNVRAGNTLVGFVARDEVKHAIGSKFDFSNTLEEIEEKAELVEKAFRRFRQLQMDFSMEEFGDAKADLGARLQELRRELDGYLGGEYGVRQNDSNAFGRWRRTHQPFHWFVEFHAIMHKGGFDAIIGNPPYVEISDLGHSYSIKNLRLTATGNLYSVFIERSTSLLRSDCRLGMIVPISSISTPRMAALMDLITKRYSPLFISNFAVRPGKLFVGADMNLTILVGKKADAEKHEILTTSYSRWASECRPFLFPTLSYYPSTFDRESTSIAKLGVPVAASTLKQLRTHPQLGSLRSEQSGETVYYHSGGRYFRKCLPQQLSNEYKEINLQQGLGKVAIAALSSSLYYFYWIVTSDCYHVTKRDVDFFPIPATLRGDLEVERLANLLVDDLWSNAETRRRSRADGTIQTETNFRVGKSKALIDSIDTALAKHYKLDPEQLDFIINYDFKFRMADAEAVGDVPQGDKYACETA